MPRIIEPPADRGDGTVSPVLPYVSRTMVPLVLGAILFVVSLTIVVILTPPILPGKGVGPAPVSLSETHSVSSDETSGPAAWPGQPSIPQSVARPVATADAHPRYQSHPSSLNNEVDYVHWYGADGRAYQADFYWASDGEWYHVRTGEPITEDSPLWNCKVMGNQECGPNPQARPGGGYW